MEDLLQHMIQRSSNTFLIHYDTCDYTLAIFNKSGYEFCNMIIKRT
jgi:hypothetical protein